MFLKSANHDRQTSFSISQLYHPLPLNLFGAILFIFSKNVVCHNSFGIASSQHPPLRSINGRPQVSANVGTCLLSPDRHTEKSDLCCASFLFLIILIRMTGICFGRNSTILRLDIPDNPSKPCLSCTKQWCLNQNLPICAGASLGDTDPDTATGKEGDVEARCFRMSSHQGNSVQQLIELFAYHRT